MAEKTERTHHKAKLLPRDYISMKLLGGVGLVKVDIINMMGSRIIFESHLWICDGVSKQSLTVVGWSSLNMSGTIPGLGS